MLRLIILNAAHPPATAGGTDPVQQWFRTLDNVQLMYLGERRVADAQKWFLSKPLGLESALVVGFTGQPDRTVALPRWYTWRGS